MANTSYMAYISANETDDVVLSFTTSSPLTKRRLDVLNLAAEVLEDGVSPSRGTPQSVLRKRCDQRHHGSRDAFATKKNHAFTTEVLPDGTYSLEVISTDASGTELQRTDFRSPSGAEG